MDVDLKQQLIYMQMSLKEIGAAFNGLERKIDATGHSISSLEQQLLQMKQAQILAKMDSGPSLVEFDNLMKKNMMSIQESLMQLAGNAGPPSRGGQDQHQLADLGQQTESLRRLEQGVSDLLAKSMAAGQENKFMSQGAGTGFMLGMGSSPGQQQPTEGKAGAPDYNGSNVRTQVREELGTFQKDFTKDLQAALMKDFTQVQDRLMQEFQHYSSAKMTAPIDLTFQSRGADFKEPRNVNVTPMMPSPIPVMSGIVMPSPESEFDGPPSSSQAFQIETEKTDVSASMQPGPNPSKPDALVPEPEVLGAQKQKTRAEEASGEEPEVSPHTILLRENGSLASVFGAEDDPENPPYHVEDAYWKTGINQAIARSDHFANITVGVVVFNAVYIGFDSDYNTAQNIYKAHMSFLLCSQFFCVYFTWELVCRFLAFEHKHACMKDGWFKFDAFLVSTMILDTWVLMPVLFLMGGGVQIPTQPLRMLRLFKLTRMARLMKSFPELVTMIKGLIRSLRAISSSMILVGLMVYVWAIMMHMLMKEETEFNDALWAEGNLGFGTMTHCIWTLLMAGTLMLDGSTGVIGVLLFSDKFNYVLGGFLFVLYALLSAMCILQMLIGVLCDVVSTVKAEEQSATAVGLLKQELLSSLTDCDDGDGKISHAELHALMTSPHSKALLKKLNVNFSFLMALMKEMYTKPGMSVPIKDILDMMVNCRGENVITIETMAGALVRIIKEVGDVKDTLERDLGSLQKSLHDDIGMMRLGPKTGQVEQLTV